jgi:prepilin-type processing-associated H-X9-DG protein
MVSEQSNWIYTVGNQRQDWRASGNHGWIIGWRNRCTPPTCGNNNDQRTFNFMTIRYPINHFSQPSHGLPTAPGNCGTHGVCDNSSTNRPLNSAHPGGVMAAMADGSVRFISQTIASPALAAAAHRDDKLTLSLNQ